MAIFNYSIWDVINHPVLKMTGKGVKTVVKGMASMEAKAANEAIVPPDTAEMLDDARRGNSDAQCALAIHYAQKQDYESASFWLEKSAAQGNEYALEILEMWQRG